MQGCGQLGGKLSGTCKWIGATEIATLLAYFHIQLAENIFFLSSTSLMVIFIFSYRLIDFHRPTSVDGKLHPALFDWVKEYFQGSSEFKPPLYFQHQGMNNNDYYYM